MPPNHELLLAAEIGTFLNRFIDLLCIPTGPMRIKYCFQIFFSVLFFHGKKSKHLKSKIKPKDLKAGP